MNPNSHPGAKEAPRRKDIGFDQWIGKQPHIAIGRPNSDNEILYTESQMRGAWIAGAEQQDGPADSEEAKAIILDAARYRFLKSRINTHHFLQYMNWHPDTWANHGGSVDTAIDSAMSSATEGRQG